MAHRKTRGTTAWIAGAGIACALLLGVLAVTMLGPDDTNTVAGIPSTGDGTWTAESFSGGPRLVADRTDVSYGPVDYGQQVEAVYRLRNVGDEVITIDEPDIKTLEGCWPPRPVVGQTTLKPGEETFIAASFTMTEGMGGPHVFEITVTSNDAVQPELALSVSADFPRP